MQNLSAAQLKYLQRGGRIGVIITAALLDSDPITLTEADIRSLTIDRNSVSGSVLEIGNSETSELSFELKNNTGAFSSVRWEGARLTVVLDIGGDPLQVGIFTVDEQPRKTKTMAIRALDDMARFNRLYVPGINYPATLEQILGDACNQCNVTQYTLTFDNGSYIVGKPPEGSDVTFHHVVSWVAELAGCNAWVDQLGRLNLSWYGDNQTGSLSLGLGDMFAYEMDESDITITGVVYRTEDIDYIVGTDDYALVIEDNPFLQTGFEVVLNTLQTKLGGFAYRPYAFSCRCYPHLWPGDVINELTDADGTVISSIITNHRYAINGRSNLKAVGETGTIRGYATGTPFTAPQKRVLRSIAKIETAHQLTEFEQAVLALNELMVNSLGYFTTTIEKPGGGKVTYTHDKPVLEESQVIWTRTEQGFAWTDQGWNNGNPVWQYGVTGDGNMVIKLLTSIGINADWINAGKIRADIITVGAGTNFEDGYDPTALRSELGDLAYEDAVEKAKLGTTIIEGGYIKADLLNADHIQTGTLSADRVSGGSLSGVTIDIGDGAFAVSDTGWIKGAHGGFSVPPSADGVFNDYGGASRWKYSSSAYIYQDSSSFAVYLAGMKFRVLADGSSYALEGDGLKQLATRQWVEENNTARFG